MHACIHTYIHTDTPHHTTSQHTTPHHTIPYHSIRYNTIPYNTIQYIQYNTNTNTIQYHAMPCHTIPYIHTYIHFCLPPPPYTPPQERFVGGLERLAHVYTCKCTHPLWPKLRLRLFLHSTSHFLLLPRLHCGRSGSLAALEWWGFPPTHWELHPTSQVRFMNAVGIRSCPDFPNTNRIDYVWMFIHPTMFSCDMLWSMPNIGFVWK